MNSLTFALRRVLPLTFSYIFIGLAYGILMHQAGYSLIWTILASALIYAGSMQIVMISLLTAGAPLLMVAAMTFFINSRHIFYGIGFVEKFRKMGRLYPYMALTMTDETYSVLCSIEYPSDVSEQKVDFYIQFIAHMLWIISCSIGAFMGQMLPIDISGIEFSATAFFVVVVLNQWRQLPSHIPAIVGLISGLACRLLLGADNFILPALSASVIALVLLKSKIPMGGVSDVE